MPLADFVHLRVHSAYSLSEGAIKLKDLVAACRREAMPAVAVTDTGNLFGALEFSMAAAEAGVQPIIGCLLRLAREEAAAPAAANGTQPAPDAIVLLVQSETGYRNLLKLISKSFLETDPGETPHSQWADLESHAEGLIALTGGPAGPVGRLLRAGQEAAAEAVLTRLAGIFPGRLYVELMRHGRPDESEARLIDLAYAHDLPLVATNDAYFLDSGMHEAHDALLCIAEGAYVGQSDRRRLTAEHRFKTAAEMTLLFADLPEAVQNTLVVAQRCAFRPQKIAPILPAFPTEAGRSEAEELQAQAEAGLGERLEKQVFTAEMDAAARKAAARPYEERLEYELGVIMQMGFPGYFLIVADFIKWAKQEGIPVGPGRGSGAGSVVAWSLTITDLNPLKWGLLFERFLNPDRVSMPDFDIDFCQDRRDEVIRYVQEKYGHDRWRRSSPSASCRPARCCATSAACCRCPIRRSTGCASWYPTTRPIPVTLCAGDRRRAGSCRRRAAATSPRWPADRHGAQAGRALPPRLDPCRRRGHRRPAALRADPALPRPALRHAGHAVLHEVRREGWAGEVRLPRPQDPDRAGNGRAT